MAGQRPNFPYHERPSLALPIYRWMWVFWISSSRLNYYRSWFSQPGCWGVKISQDRPAIVRAAKQMFSENHLHEYDYDQKLLDRFIWPIATTNMARMTPKIESISAVEPITFIRILITQMAHDSYCCEKIPLGQPFPTQRKDGFFIGWRAVPTEELQFPCPQRCRPVNVTSPDWNFCWNCDRYCLKNNTPLSNFM